VLSIPNPTRRTALVTLDAVGRHRSLFCRDYDDCLEAAARQGWTSWSCERCAMFVVLRPSEAAAPAQV